MVWRGCKFFISCVNREADESLNRHNFLWATMEVYINRGLVNSSKVLNIRQVDVSSEHTCYRHYLTDPIHRLLLERCSRMQYRSSS